MNTKSAIRATTHAVNSASEVIAHDHRLIATDRIIQVVIACALAIIGFLIVNDYKDVMQATKTVPSMAARIDWTVNHVSEIADRVEHDRNDRFTGTDGRAMEERLNGGLKELKQDLGRGIQENRDDIQQLRRDLRSSLTPSQQERFDRAAAE